MGNPGLKDQTIVRYPEDSYRRIQLPTLEPGDEGWCGREEIVTGAQWMLDHWISGQLVEVFATVEYNWLPGTNTVWRGREQIL